MDFSELWQSFQAAIPEHLPGLLGALLILIGGWIVAVILRAVVRKGLGLLKTNDRLRSATGKEMDIEGGTAKGAFLLVMVLVLIAFFDALNLELVSEPLRALTGEIFGYAPRLVAAAILALVVWALATVLRMVAARALGATRLDEKLASAAGMRPASESLAHALYWLVIFLFLPAILGVLGIEGLLAPVQDMVTQILAHVPNILAAVAIGVAGWLVARVLRDLVANLLSAAGADRLGEKAGLSGNLPLSRLVALFVYVFVLVPALIAALDALRIEAISGPATQMLTSLMAAVPHIVAAALILGAAYLVSRFVAGIVTSLLAGIGFDAVPEKLGLGFLPRQPAPSDLVGKFVIVFAMLFATAEAAGRLGFARLSELVAAFIEFGGQVLLGLAVIAIGFWISGLVASAVRRGGSPQAATLATIARVAIVGFVIAMGLRAMGVADSVVNMAFGLTLGSIAVAVALGLGLAFGLGGREAAGRQLEHWFRKLRGEA